MRYPIIHKTYGFFNLNRQKPIRGFYNEEKACDSLEHADKFFKNEYLSEYPCHWRYDGGGIYSYQPNVSGSERVRVQIIHRGTGECNDAMIAEIDKLNSKEQG